jgi:hypothetical protein
LADVEAWLKRLDAFWVRRLRRLARHMETRP